MRRVTPLLLVALVGLVGAKKPAAATRPADDDEAKAGTWVEVGRGVKARGFVGFWMEEARPGEAGKVVRLFRESNDEHFGVTMEFNVPRGFTGELKYKETITLPAKARTWDEVGEEEKRRGIQRIVSGDKHAATVWQPVRFRNGQRVGDREFPFLTYTFDAGDPVGEWEIAVWVNDVSVGRWRFKVVLPEDKVKDPVVTPEDGPKRDRPAGAAVD